MQYHAAAQLPGEPLPLAVIDELKGVTIKEVLYRNASLYDVCGHLRQVIENVKPGGAFTNISLIGTKHATAAAVPARITLSDADTSMWETLTNALIKPGTIGNLDFQLAILAIRFNLDEIAYERGIAYLKRGGEFHRALLDRLFDIAKRLGRESPTEAMLRLDNANTPTAQQE